MRRRLCLLALPLLLSATGCSSPGYFEAVQPSTSQRAVVYLYRPEATTPGLMKPLRYDYPDLQIDGQSIGTLKYNKHRWVELAPGQHSLRITGLSQIAKWESRDITYPFTVTPGEIKYLKLDVQYKLDEMVLGQPAPRYLIRVIPQRGEEAVYEIRQTQAQR